MTRWDESKLPSKVTISAIDLLLTLFTEEEKDVLKIERNGTTVTLTEQFLSRWWNHLPLADHPLIFKAEAMKILDANKRWIEFLKKIQTDDIFKALLDPENYKEKSRKLTRAKLATKNSVSNSFSSSNLVKTLSRNASGDAALDGSWDYSQEWDRADKERLDQMTLIKEKPKILNTDDSSGDDSPEPAGDWISQRERIEYKQPEQNTLPTNLVKFLDKNKEIPNEKGILLHTAAVGHQSNATGGETVSSAVNFMENLKRQNFDTTKERVILAEAILKIENIDFPDIRERLYKKFDDLFYLNKKYKCR